MGVLKQVFSEAKILHSSFLNVWRNRAVISKLTPSEMFENSLNNYKKHLEEKTKILTTCGTIGVTYAIGELIAQTINKSYDFSRIMTFGLYGTAFGGPCFYAWFSYLDKIPGKMIVESNKYQKLFFEKIPSIMENNLKIKTEKNMPIDAYLQEPLKFEDKIIPPETQVKVYIPANTEIPITNLELSPNKIENINKWTIKGVKVIADQLLFSSTYTLFLICMTGILTGKDMVSIAQTIQSSFWKIYLIDCLVWPPLQLINFTFIKKEYQPIYVNVINIFWNTFLSLCLAGHGH